MAMESAEYWIFKAWNLSSFFLQWNQDIIWTIFISQDLLLPADFLPMIAAIQDV